MVRCVDIMRLRREWRIMGSLVGTIDRCSEVGPPLKLSRDEVTLLLQKGNYPFACLLFNVVSCLLAKLIFICLLL